MGAEGRTAALHTPVFALAMHAQAIPTTFTAVDLVQPVDADVGAAALLAIFLDLVCFTENKYRIIFLFSSQQLKTSMESFNTTSPTVLLTMHAHRRSVTIDAELLALPVLAQSLAPALTAVTLGLAMRTDHRTLALAAVALYNHHQNVRT